MPFFFSVDGSDIWAKKPVGYGEALSAFGEGFHLLGCPRKLGSKVIGSVVYNPNSSPIYK